MSLFDQFNWQGERGFPYYWGYYWIGPIQPHIIPPTPGLTDTATGIVYYMTLNPAGDHIVFTTAAPPGPQKVLGANDYLPIGQQGYALRITNAHLVAVQMHGLSGPGPFAPNTQAGVATLVGGLFVSGPDGFVDAAMFNNPHITVAVGNIRSVTTPSEPSQIAQPATYQTYYTQLQDNSSALP